MTASAAAAAPLAPKRSSRHLASSSSSAVRGRAVGAGAGRQRLSAAPSSSSGSDGKHRRGALQVSAAGLPPDLAGMMGNMDPAKLKEIQEQYAKAMKDPATAKKVNEQMAQMQGMMNNPMVAKQMQAMNNMIAVRRRGVERVVRLCVCGACRACNSSLPRSSLYLSLYLYPLSLPLPTSLSLSLYLSLPLSPFFRCVCCSPSDRVRARVHIS